MKLLLFGNRDGHHLCPCSPNNGVGWPPAAGIIRRPSRLLGAYTIISHVSQTAPRGSAEASASVTAGLRPFASIFLSELCAKKPIERPSGDQNGCWPPSVPASQCGTGSFMVRT